jgi:hypothetical protein
MVTDGTKRVEVNSVTLQRSTRRPHQTLRLDTLEKKTAPEGPRFVLLRPPITRTYRRYFTLDADA